jgi:uncharacterized membrane protein
MDWKLLGFSTIAVFLVLGITGFVISLLSSQLQCSKRNLTEHTKQGFISATAPALVYALAAAFQFVRSPFSNTLASFGIPTDKSNIVGVGYVTMIIFWITSVWNIHQTEAVVCNPDLKEMTAFKKKLLAELHQKEIQKEENAQKS